jgi:HEAT repeat protein
MVCKTNDMTIPGGSWIDCLASSADLLAQLQVQAALVEARALDALIAALHYPDGAVRWRAAVAFGIIGDQRAVDVLLAAFADTEYEVRCGAVWSLMMMGAPRVFEPVQAQLSDPDESVVLAAAMALMRIDRVQAERVLTPLLAQGGFMLRKAAKTALEMYTYDL